MDITEVLGLIRATRPKKLTPVQERVLRYAWEGRTYTRMAETLHYQAEYLRNTASDLWHLLSELFQVSISKANFRSALEARPLNPEQKKLIEALNSRKPSRSQLKFPSGPLPLDSPFYIDRPPIEETAYQEILAPGSVIRLKAPRQRGKSSLLLRLLDRAVLQGFRTASLDFQQADKAVLTSLDKFLRWFSANISRELGIEAKLDEYWDEDIGSKVSCTIYFQAYLLEQLDRPLVLSLNEVNRVFEYPEIAEDFLPMLRFWHEEAKNTEIWQKLRLVVAYSTEIYIPLKLNQSPFNVGLPLKLPSFTLEQAEELAQRYELNALDRAELEQSIAVVGGHPYLLQLAFYHLCWKELTLKELLQQAATASGIYCDHLGELLAALEEDSNLKMAYQKAIAVESGVRLEARLAHQLDSLGLVLLEGDRVTPSCELYRSYFRQQLLHGFSIQNPGPPDPEGLEQLQRENEQLRHLSHIDTLTQLPNRRYFEQQLAKEWRRLAREATPLSLILCDIDRFKLYNDYFGMPAADVCLQQIAMAIYAVVRRPADLVARYGGQEFAVILPQTDAVGAVYVAEAIRQKVKALEISSILLSSENPRLSQVTVSFGVASTIPDSKSDPILLIAAANEALARSKQEGRDRVTLTSQLDFAI
jgi:diguanylate cyclase (GGDEF)-like protein